MEFIVTHITRYFEGDSYQAAFKSLDGEYKVRDDISKELAESLLIDNYRLLTYPDWDYDMAEQHVIVDENVSKADTFILKMIAAKVDDSNHYGYFETPSGEHIIKELYDTGYELINSGDFVFEAQNAAFLNYTPKEITNDN